MENYKNLPILQHFEGGQIKEGVDSFRKGEKGLFWFLKLGALIALLYFSWVYVLPPLFQAIGQALAIGGTLVVAIGLIIAAPAIIKGLRLFARFLHKTAIKHDPFAELESQRAIMVQNKKKFQKSKGTIIALKEQSEIGAKEAEEKANSLRQKIVSISEDANKYKEQMNKMEAQLGDKAKGEDKYITLATKWRSKVSEGQRKGHILKQEQDFVVKYGSRAAIMKKFSQKLTMVEGAMEIKILDFDATVEILKRDYKFAQESKEATTAAKKAMGETGDWKLDYALDVVTSTIAQDIAITSGNLNDIDYLMTNYATDSDELFDNLNLLADDINTGVNITKSAKAYSGEDYELTHEDRLASGGFGGNNIF